MDGIITDLLQSSFSVGVACYLLVRMESRLDDLTTAITRLQGAITGLTRGAEHDRVG